MPLLSVIVPVYNVESYLAECLDSLLAQTFKDMEIICVNDGSTDNSGTILARYAEQHPNIINIITQKNKGISSARNAGMAVAQGTFTAFCDSDDTVVPHAYQTALDCFTDDIDSVCFGTEPMYELDDILPADLSKLKRTHTETFTLPAKWPSGEKKHIPFSKMLSFNCCVWNKIYRTDVLRNIHLTFREGYCHEDNLFHCCFFAVSPNTYFLPEKLYRYRIRSGSIMSGIRARNGSGIHLVLLLRDMIDFYYANNILPAHAEDFVSMCESLVSSAWPVLTPNEQARAVYEIAELLREYSLPLLLPENLCSCAVNGTYTVHWGRNRFTEFCLKAINQTVYSWNKALSNLCSGKFKETAQQKYRLARLNIKALKR